MLFLHARYALGAPAVSPMPHQILESEAVGGPSLRLSGTGSPAGSDSPNGASGARSIPPDRAPCFLGFAFCDFWNLPPLSAGCARPLRALLIVDCMNNLVAKSFIARFS